MNMCEGPAPRASSLSIKRGHATWISSIDMQHGRVAWSHVHAACISKKKVFCGSGS
jgi:hypothetical protein